MVGEKFQILSARDHIRARTGMYLGSTSVEEVEQFLFGKWVKVKYTPALFKMINEIIDNSIDEAIRTSYEYATKIDVTIDGSTVTIVDNGRGIPQEMTVTPEGEKISRPVAAWTRVNAGTSFEAERTSIGANGVGSAASNFMSASFYGTTWSNGKCLHVICSDGAAEIKTKETKKSGNGTSVTFTPEFSLFECDSFAGQDISDLVEDRLIGLQMAFPQISFSFNGTKIKIKNLKQYAEMFSGSEGASVITERSDGLTFFFTSSNDGFRSNSFINGVNTRLGGTYVDFIVNSVADELLVMIKRKHKIDITKSVLKNGLTFVMFARDFINPKYDSQTKERLTNALSEVKKHFDGESIKDFKAIAKKIFGADDIIEPIIAAQIEKKKAEERRNAIVAQKKLKKVKVAKHIAASSPEASLSLCEGDCLLDDTEIETSDGPKKIKDIIPGDLVFTHKNRYMPVLSKSYALKEGIRINGIIMSENHRMFVYDVNANKFDVLPASEIVKGKHKLIRNRVVQHGISRSMHIVRKMTSVGFNTDTMEMHFSKEHEIICMNENLECVIKTIDEITVGEIVFI